MRLFSHGRYATVASTAALVVALAGTSYAAGVVTGKDIKDNTVTTKDVKNKTLKVKDLSPGAREDLAGAAGPAGPTGPVGPSSVFSVFNNFQTATGNIPKTVLSLALAPGSYAVSSKALGYATGANAFIECWLEGSVADFSSVTFPAVDARAMLTNQIAFTSTVPSTVSLYCRGDAATMTHKKVTAIKVGSVALNEGPIVP